MRQGQAGLGSLFARRLNLTDDQVEKIRDILTQSRAKAKASVKEVLTDEQVKQLEQIRERAAQRGQGARGSAWQDGPGGPAGGRFQRGQGHGVGMGPRGQDPAGQPFAGGPGAGRGMRSFRGRNWPDAATEPPTGVGETDAAPSWNRGVPPIEQMFDQADADKDGALTRDEIRAFHRTRGAGPGGQRP